MVIISITHKKEKNTPNPIVALKTHYKYNRERSHLAGVAERREGRGGGDRHVLPDTATVSRHGSHCNKKNT